MDTRRKRILVTGASGLIGHALVQRLAALDGYEIVAVTSGRRQVPFPEGVQVEAADLLDEGARAALLERVRPDVMIHYAWSLKDNAFLASDSNIRWLEASLTLLELFHRYGGKRFIFAGSTSEYGDGIRGYSEFPREQTYILYGVCKLAFDRIGTAYAREFGFSFATARYGAVYGPGDNRPGRGLPLAIQTLLKNDVFECGRPWNCWDYIYIDDAVQATVKLIKGEYCGPINIVSGQPAMMKDVFLMLADIVGRPELVKYNENNVGGTAFYMDVSNMQSVLQYTCATPLRSGLEKTVAWWRLRQ